MLEIVCSARNWKRLDTTTRLAFFYFFVPENLRNHTILTTIGSTSDHRHHVSLRIYWIWWKPVRQQLLPLFIELLFVVVLCNFSHSFSASMDYCQYLKSDCSSQNKVVLEKKKKIMLIQQLPYMALFSGNWLLEDRHPEFMDDVVGLVTLLATASTPTLGNLR